MLAGSEKHFNKFYWPACFVVLVVILLRNHFIPMSHDEVATFYFYIQPGSFVPFLCHIDANGHFLTNLTSWFCYKLMGSSTFVLRLPNVFAFVIMCIAVHKLTGLFKHTLTKVALSFFFILAFNFIAFFSLCRGYGISMAFLVLALYYYFLYFRFFSNRHLLLFLLFSQIALSANLTLVFVLLICTGFLMLVQLTNGLFFKAWNILLLLLHFGLIAFWVSYAFFLQKNGALYYGEGDGYWRVTFATLIETIAFKNTVLNIVIVVIFALMLGYFIYQLVKQKFSYIVTNNFGLSFVSLLILIVAFYLLKHLMGVNYPEDRTGMFFYVFYGLSFCFMIDELQGSWRYAGLIAPFFFGTHFVCSMNISTHQSKIYETYPQSFFDTLVSEQQKTNYPITVGGYRLREFIYGFMNLNSKTKLNHITAPEALQMNCDYAVALDLDKPWYDKYYSELASEPKWGFRLLKRKKPLEKKLFYAITQKLHFNGEGEFFNACDISDTTFAEENPLMAEFNFTVEEIVVPFNAWLVLQMDDDAGNNYYVRTPLNLIKKNWWETDNFTTCLVSGNMPRKVKRMVAYLWNIDKKMMKIRINSFKLYQLQGEGVTEISQAKI